MKKHDRPRRLEHWHKITALMMLYDFVAVMLSYFLALWMRYDCRISEIEPDYIRTFLIFAPIYGLICMAGFWFFRLYKSIWRFASFSELQRTMYASLLTGAK